MARVVVLSIFVAALLCCVAAAIRLPREHHHPIMDASEHQPAAGSPPTQVPQPSPSPGPNVPVAAFLLERAFSNITMLRTNLGSLFAENGVWCSQMGSPCTVGAANITTYAAGFGTWLSLVDAVARFTDLSVNNAYGSFDYVKTFTCNVSCGPRTCLVPGKSGMTVDDNGKIVSLYDYVDGELWQSLCVDRCTCQSP